MGRRPATGIGAAVAVLAAGGALAVLTWPGGTPQALPASLGSVPSVAPDRAAAAPGVRTRIDELKLSSAPGAFPVPPRATKRFSMLSIHWTDPRARPKGTVQVRTRAAGTGRWSGWRSLRIAEDGADRAPEKARVRGATEPLWAGPSDGVATRVVGAGGTALPAGLRLNLIDPDAPRSTGGTGGGMAEPVAAAATPGVVTPPPPPALGEDPADSAGPGDADGTPAPPIRTTAPPTTKPTGPAVAPPAKPAAPVTLVPAATMPPVVSRAGWGADEKLVHSPATVAREGVKMIWVHHGGFEASYTCAQAPSLIRGILANDVRKGYDDIGYNFLVDKCGTLYEGRKGSTTAAVVGAHVAGFNTGSAGIALLGDYTKARPTEAALTTIAKVAAARLAAYGFTPLSTATMVEGVPGKLWPLGAEVTFPRIAGHSDGDRTAAGPLTDCPGVMLHPLLDRIRARAAMPGLALTPVGGGAVLDGTTYVRTTATVNWTVAAGSTGIAQFDVLRDGVRVATAPGTARSASIPVPPGTHTVAVRASHVSGVTDVTPARRVVADMTAPTFPGAPVVTLRTGAYSTTTVPVTVTFRSADNVKVVSQAATAPAATPLSATSTVWHPTVRVNAPVTYTVTARDLVGNVGKVSAVRTATALPETSAKRTGAWTTRTGAAYLGGKALSATGRNAKLAYVFTGRSAALTFARMPATGVAYVYLDGVKVATVDTKATTAYRQTLWVRALTARTHTVSVVVAGTKGRPTVIADGLTYLG